MIWCGDDIAWFNLYKHYVYCLHEVYRIYKIVPSDLNITPGHIPVHKHPELLNEPLYEQIFDKILARIIDKTDLNSFIKRSFNMNRPVRRSLLWNCLYAIHDSALKLIQETYIDFGLLLESERRRYDHTDRFEMFDELGIFEKLETTKNHNYPEHIFAEKKARDMGRSLSHVFSTNRDNIDSIDHNLRFLLFEFTSGYIDCLESLLHPDWYAACFSGSDSSPTMWSHYGDHHRGAALIFETENLDGIDGLRLTLGPILGQPSTESKSEVFNCYDVTYTDSFNNPDFFYSIASFGNPKLLNYWLMDDDLNLSRSVADIDPDTPVDEMQQKLMGNFIWDVTNKNDAWSYENEIRIILPDLESMRRDAKSRVLKYEFESLKGIVFGIKTSEIDKLRIMAIIDKLCQNTNRPRFEIFQAHFSSYTNKVEKTAVTYSK